MLALQIWLFRQRRYSVHCCQVAYFKATELESRLEKILAAKKEAEFQKSDKIFAWILEKWSELAHQPT
jgi:hypothetical protein